MELTNEQKLAITSEKNLSLIASAGMGKTTVLTKRFIHCYQKRGRPLHSILAFTFTEKASREMQRRIIESGAISFEESALLNISTIHGFCHKLLKKHAALLQIDPDFDVIDPDSANLWIKARVDHFIKENLESEERIITVFLKRFGYENLRKAILDLFEQDLANLPDNECACINLSDEIEKDDLTAFLQLNKVLQSQTALWKLKNNFITYDDLETLALNSLKIILKHSLDCTTVTRTY